MPAEVGRETSLEFKQKKWLLLIFFCVKKQHQPTKNACSMCRLETKIIAGRGGDSFLAQTLFFFLYIFIYYYFFFRYSRTKCACNAFRLLTSQLLSHALMREAQTHQALSIQFSESLIHPFFFLFCFSFREIPVAFYTLPKDKKKKKKKKDKWEIKFVDNFWGESYSKKKKNVIMKSRFFFSRKKQLDHKVVKTRFFFYILF